MSRQLAPGGDLQSQDPEGHRDALRLLWSADVGGVGGVALPCGSIGAPRSSWKI